MTSKPGLQVWPSLRRVRSPSRGGGALGAGGGGTGLCLACLMLCPAWGGRWISHPGMASSLVHAWRKWLGRHSWATGDTGRPFNSQTLSTAQVRVGRPFGLTETCGPLVRVAALDRLPALTVKLHALSSLHRPSTGQSGGCRARTSRHRGYTG